MSSLVLADSAASNPGVVAVSVLIFILLFYCAYRTARNGRWLFFILGFFCGGLFWVLGAILGPKD